MAQQPHSILAIEVAPFGVSLEILPAMKALRVAYPGTFLIAAAPSGTCELIQTYGFADATVNLGVVRQSAQGSGDSIKRIIRLFRDTRRTDVEIVLDFSPRLETQLISRIAIGGRTITPSRMPPILEGLFGRARPRMRGNLHADDVASVLEQLGLKIEDERLNIVPPAEENEKFEKLLARHGSRGGEPVIALYASNTGGTRGWPIENFGELAANLANNFGARIVVADEPSGTEFTDAIEAMLPQGAIKLREPRALELAAAIARASLLVTDEPGVARMAMSLDAPVLEITDVGSARSNASKSHRVVAGASRARIPVAEVFDVACLLLQESRSVSLFRR